MADPSPTDDLDLGVLSPLPDCAVALGVPVTRVHQYVREGALLTVRRDGVRLIPADFIQDGELLKGLRGVVTVLRDAGYDDAESLRWLYTADDTLPGTPVTALRENRGTEVRRRAQALGF